MRRLLVLALTGIAALAASGTAAAQAPRGRGLNPPVDLSRRTYAAPGFYGTTYGSASYGLTRTYSSFASPYGPGYGYGYYPYRFLPGPYGIGMWRPGYTAPGYAYYGTFAVYPDTPPIVPGIGAYAPAFGPTPAWVP